MKIVYFGVPDLGLICLKALLENNKKLTAIVPPPSSHPAHSLMVDTANLYGVPSIFFRKSPKEPDFIESFKALNPDVAIVCAFDQLIPEEMLKIPPMGFINCHPSLLPEYRGGNPYFSVILNNEEKTGITLHYMDKTFDTGDIITQWETKIQPDETLGTLFNRLNFKSAEMIVELVEKIEKGETLPKISQDKSGNHKPAPVIKHEDTIIDWQKDAFYISRLVRASNPVFGATTFFRNCMIKIWSGTFSEKQHSSHRAGTISDISKNKLGISTGKGTFYPACLQIEHFLITDIEDFIKRVNPQPGETFTNGYEVQ